MHAQLDQTVKALAVNQCLKVSTDADVRRRLSGLSVTHKAQWCIGAGNSYILEIGGEAEAGAGRAADAVMAMQRLGAVVAAADADAVADAASTSKSHLALSVFELIGVVPLDVCDVLAM